MRTFWVNQGQTFEQERRAEVLWAPKNARPRKDGRPGPALSHWQRLLDAEPGDAVLHYAGGSVRAWSTVTQPAFDGPPPFEDPTTRWSSDGRILRLNMQMLADPVALSEVPLGMRTSKDATSWPFRRDGKVKQVYLTELEGEVVGWFQDRLGLAEDALQLPTFPEGMIIDDAIPYNGDRRVVTYQRGEQAALRRALFKSRSVDRCSLCGREMPVALLVAAHIQRRADTSWRERGNLENLMPACALGCDALFELGYVSVLAGGTIAQGPRRNPMTAELAATVAALEGRLCLSWSEGRERFFAHRRVFNGGIVQRFGLD